jgi:predicted AlkP superfamily phosphohydrolase/phosphomutase
VTHWGVPAYFGPGAGFALLGSLFSLLLAALAGIASAIFWPFRMAWSLVARPRRARFKKAIFLGLDGLDPVITEKLMAEGKLPNFARLRDKGSYRRLRTTFPALSPIVWSTFATGVNPAKHNVFDFGSPLSRATAQMRRVSEPFWNILGRHSVTSTILRVPVPFPIEAFNGRTLSGLSTPDLLGTQGTYSRFSASEGALAGPEGTSVPFRVRDGRLDIQGKTYPLMKGAYTPWIRLRFGSVSGIVRFLPVRGGKEFDLYATPVQIDPENPAFPISHPPYYASYLAKLLGTFSTLGRAEDTSALNEGAIGRDDFLEQVKLIRQEREAMFFSALERTRRGVVACVFDTADCVQHMFHGQPDVIEPLYCDMDRIVGKMLAHLDEDDADTAVFVLSDHGFCAFRRGVNLNSWLLREGYLTLNAGLAASGAHLATLGDNLEGIDWAKTRAYAFGLAGVYLNLVDEEQAPALIDELVRKLTGLRDEETDEIAIRAVYRATDIYRGPYLNAAPDLIIGYAAGYRTSWDAARGRVASAVFEDNREAWCGDHCVDPPLVPGVLFSNLAMTADDPGIEDLAPTALSLFGVPVPAWMEGRPLIAEA